MKKLFKFLSDWHEIITIPIAVVIFYVSGYVIRFFDSTSGLFDSGIWQTPIISIVKVLVYSAATWLLIKFTFPGLYNYLDNKIEENFTNNITNLTEWERSKIALWLFSLFLLAFLLMDKV